MKNIFKFAGLALLSLTMLAACGNKDSEETSYKVTFRGTEYNSFPVAQAKIVNFDGEQCILFEGHPQDITGVQSDDPASVACPGFRVIVRGTSTGTYKANGIDHAQMTLLGQVRSYEFFSEGWVYGNHTDSGMQEIGGDWWGLNDVKVEVTKFDTEKGLASFTASGELFRFFSYFQVGMDNAPKGMMTMTVENIPIK